MFGYCPNLMASFNLNYLLNGIVSDCRDIRGYSFDMNFEEDTIQSVIALVNQSTVQEQNIFKHTPFIVIK